MKVYLPAFLVTLIVGVGFVAAFSYWRQLSHPVEAERRVLSVEQMEKEGLPLFQGKTIDGEPFQLADHKGKVVVVNFWASWCAPCVEEFPSLLKLAEEMKGQMILVAVSGDSTEDDIRSFTRQLPDSWNKPWIKVIWDEDKSISTMYDVERLPESFVASPELKLVKKIIGTINWYTPDSVQYVNEILNKK